MKKTRKSRGMNSFVIVVSGLPRSGTSMMMRMLEAGSINIVVDNICKADDDNPKGYFEDERVKNLKENNSWLNDSLNNKAIKIISFLLYNLPQTNFYKIIFMERDMEEILKSQKKMLSKNNESSDTVDDATMTRKFNEHLGKIKKWLKDQRNIDCIYVKYHDVLREPLKYADKIKKFLNFDLNTEQMVKAIDKRLYRNKKND